MDDVKVVSLEFLAAYVLLREHGDGWLLDAPRLEGAFLRGACLIDGSRYEYFIDVDHGYAVGLYFVASDIVVVDSA